MVSPRHIVLVELPRPNRRQAFSSSGATGNETYSRYALIRVVEALRGGTVGHSASLGFTAASTSPRGQMDGRSRPTWVRACLARSTPSGGEIRAAREAFVGPDVG